MVAFIVVLLVGIYKHIKPSGLNKDRPGNKNQEVVKMGFMEKVAANLATKYGVVTEGRHKGCEVALGNDPSKKVATSDSFEQIIFVEGSEEKGRYTIDSDIKNITVEGMTSESIQMCIVFSDNEVCRFGLIIRQADSFGKSLLKASFGFKSISDNGSEAAQAEKFRRVRVFVGATLTVLTASAAEFFLKLYKENKILDDNIEKALKNIILIKKDQ